MEAQEVGTRLKAAKAAEVAERVQNAPHVPTKGKRMRPQQQQNQRDETHLTSSAPSHRKETVTQVCKTERKQSNSERGRKQVRIANRPSCPGTLPGPLFITHAAHRHHTGNAVSSTAVQAGLWLRTTT